MAKRTTKAAQIIDDALAADPHIPTATLVKRLLKLHPKCWPTKNACDCAVRKQRGAQGEKNRRWTPYTARPHEESETCRKWGALLPDPAENKWAWQSLPKGVTRWLVMSDVHLPYHDGNALRAMLEFSQGNCEGVLLNGDILDCYALSKWEKDPEQIDFDGELNAMEKLLDTLVAWGAKHIVWKLGNHEYRLERFLISKAPELLASRRVREKLGFDSFLNLTQRGIMLIDSMDPIAVGKLCVLHGHEMGAGFSSPVNPARGVYLKGKECCLIGHEHRTSEHTEQSMLGTTITTWSTGCLANLRPRYRPFNKWNHGFAVLDLSGQDWRIENRRIVDGRVV